MSIANNTDSILKILKELNDSTCFNVYIPSLQKEATFKQLNTEQLKQILETITDSSTLNNNFNQIFLKIIKENLVSEDINAENLNIYDVHYIALHIRLNSLSEKYISYFSEDEIETYNLIDSKYEIDLQRLIESKSVNNIPDEEIVDKQIKITCQTPTVQNEIEYLNFFNELIKTSIIKDIQKIIGEIFVYEIAKSIKTVTINNETIVFNDIPFSKKIEIVNQLPTTTTKLIITYIEKYKTALYDLYSVDIETEINGEKLVLQKQLQYNANLFNY